VGANVHPSSKKLVGSTADKGQINAYRQYRQNFLLNIKNDCQNQKEDKE